MSDKQKQWNKKDSNNNWQQQQNGKMQTDVLILNWSEDKTALLSWHIFNVLTIDDYVYTRKEETQTKKNNWISSSSWVAKQTNKQADKLSSDERAE